MPKPPRERIQHHHVPQPANVYNIIMCPNPTAAKTVVVAMEMALKEGRQDWIPSFFQDLESPSVQEYKNRQEAVLHSVMEDA
jgi:hypothetical protein